MIALSIAHPPSTSDVSPTNVVHRRAAAFLIVGERVGLGATMAAITASHAFAQAFNTEPGQVLQNILTIITGSFGTALATLGIICCGLAWMFGRASLGLVSGVVGGIMIVFCAGYVAKQLIGAG